MLLKNQTSNYSNVIMAVVLEYLVGKLDMLLWLLC